MTVALKKSFCTRCNKVVSTATVTHRGVAVIPFVEVCPECGKSDRLDRYVHCGDCGRMIRESTALNNDVDGALFCRECRVPCSICGQGYKDEDLSAADEDGLSWCVYCEMNERERRRHYA